MEEKLTLATGDVLIDNIPSSTQMRDYQQCEEWQLNQVLNHSQLYTYHSSSPLSTNSSSSFSFTLSASHTQHAVSCTYLSGLHSPQFAMLQLVNTDQSWINENAWIGWRRDLCDQINQTHESICRREFGVQWKRSINLMTNQPYMFTITHSVPFFLPALHPALYDLLTRRRLPSLLSPSEALGKLRTLDDIVLLLPIISLVS